MKINGNEIKPGNIIQHNDAIWVAVKTSHVKPGKGGAFAQVELKKIPDGTKLNERFRASETVERLRLDNKTYQYLFTEGNLASFMDKETYEQIEINSAQIGDAKKWLIGQEVCEIVLWNSDPIEVNPPVIVDLKITSSEPGIKGDTVSGATKKAILETGVEVQVPLFVNENETIKVDTRDMSYIGRSKS